MQEMQLVVSSCTTPSVRFRAPDRAGVGADRHLALAADDRQPHHRVRIGDQHADRAFLGLFTPKCSIAQVSSHIRQPEHSSGTTASFLAMGRLTGRMRTPTK